MCRPPCALKKSFAMVSVGGGKEAGWFGKRDHKSQRYLLASNLKSKKEGEDGESKKELLVKAAPEGGMVAVVVTFSERVGFHTHTPC